MTSRARASSADGRPAGPKKRETGLGGFPVGRLAYTGSMAQHARKLRLREFFLTFHGWNEWFDRKTMAARKLSPEGLHAAADRMEHMAETGEMGKAAYSMGRDALIVGMVADCERVVQIPLRPSRLHHLAWWIGQMGLEELSDDDKDFILSANGRINVVLSPSLYERARHRLTLTKEVLRGIFPRKSHPYAGRKANMFLDHLIRDIESLSGVAFQDVCTIVKYIEPGQLTDDQFCSAIVFAWALSAHISFGVALAYAISCIINPERGKMVSDLLKATGSTCSLIGCCLTEAHTLLGRGVGRVDLVADAGLRVGSNPHFRVAAVDQEALASAISHLLDIELEGAKVDLPAPEAFWKERFKWCVAGNHSKAANRHWDKHLGFSPPGDRRFTRRICAELQDRCPFSDWDATVGVSVGEKIEHAKSRAIYSCDTLSYFAFSWLLTQVEREWKGKRIILDPGKDGSLGIFGRVVRSREESGLHCYTMADFADFNSQHSLESQKTLVKVLLTKVNNPDPVLAEKLINSFDNMECYYLGWYLGKVNSTLMSGHRATTFINSILNAAYCMLAWGKETFSRIRSFHVGDDVVIMARDCDEGWWLLDSLQSIGCTLQPSKQSVGYHVFEFLRMAGVAGKGARGYVCRAIAGLVSGNWVTENAMEPREGLFSLITQFRSIINRSGNKHAYKIGLSSSSKITNIDTVVLDELLSGQTAVYPGPCFRNDGKYVYRRILEDDGETAAKRESKVLLRQPLNATYDYITEGLHPVERYAIDVVGFAPVTSMAIASYGLSRPSTTGEDSDVRRRVVLSPRESVWLPGCINTTEVTTTEVLHGLLACYPIAQLLRKELNASAIQRMLQILGVGGSSTDLFALAWGTEHVGSVVYGALPYSDAAGIGARFNKGTIMVDTPINM